MVLRILPYLVKKNIAIDARINVLVQGHTKKDCDQLFNIMKKEYQESYADLTTCVNHH